MISLNETDPQTSNFNLLNPENTYLFGKSSFSNKIIILYATIDYILSTKRFDKPLF